MQVDKEPETRFTMTLPPDLEYQLAEMATSLDRSKGWIMRALLAKAAREVLIKGAGPEGDWELVRVSAEKFGLIPTVVDRRG